MQSDTNQLGYQVESPDRKFFTLEEANRALPYVSRIAGDIRDVYAEIRELQFDLDANDLADDFEQKQSELQELSDRLNGFAQELWEIGVELKDCEKGLLDFPALREGREVYLCWRLGESEIVAWHEIHAGFMGRREIATF